jgi:hypothetical protein
MKKSLNTKTIRLTPSVIKLTNDGKTIPQMVKELNICYSTIKKIIDDNHLSYTKTIKPHAKPKRNQEILNLINQNYTFESIAKKFKITKQRVNQIAKSNNISKWNNIREENKTLNELILKDIDNDIQYKTILKKYNITNSKINRTFKVNNNVTLKNFLLNKRNKQITTMFVNNNTAKNITQTISPILSSPNHITSIGSIYRINTKHNVKRFPQIKNRRNKKMYESKKIKQYIKRKHNINKWSFRKIAEQLNKLGHKTITNKEYKTPNVARIYNKIINK